MNMLPRPTQAMLQGIAQGDQQVQSILPNTYQPQGKAVPQNPWQGSIDLLIDQVLSLGRAIKGQGDKFREHGDAMMEISVKLGKVNRALDACVEEGYEDNE